MIRRYDLRYSIRNNYNPLSNQDVPVGFVLSNDRCFLLANEQSLPRLARYTLCLCRAEDMLCYDSISLVPLRHDIQLYPIFIHIPLLSDGDDDVFFSSPADALQLLLMCFTWLNVIL